MIQSLVFLDSLLFSQIYSGIQAMQTALGMP
jgi:hypothetical protein